MAYISSSSQGTYQQSAVYSPNSTVVPVYSSQHNDNHIGGCRKTCITHGQCSCK